MIQKEQPDRQHQRRSRLEAAGDAAERQMAFYLRRRFAEDPDIHVFNDLRVDRGGEVAQMDHLVLHRLGFFIIESKSVTGEIQVNAQLEFVRLSGGKRSGMASPIQQAERQGALLRRLLIDHKETLRRKMAFGLVQGGFKHCPIQTLVAISDGGIITRPRRDIPELLKADQITDRIAADIDRHRRSKRLAGKDEAGWGEYTFHPDETRAVIEFLLATHTEPTRRPAKPRPADTPPRPVAPSRPAAPPATYLCSHCHGTDLEIRYGRSYYFKCRACDDNTPIRNSCRQCGRATKTRKRGPEFTAVCTECGAEEMYFRNPD